MLAPLKFLRVLKASYNDLSNIDEICRMIRDWYHLKELALAHNPICKSRLYREDVIANAYCLGKLYLIGDTDVEIFKNHFRFRKTGPKRNFRSHQKLPEKTA